MTRHDEAWTPLFVEDPALFGRIMARDSLDRRIQAWPGFADLLVGEPLRQIRQPDAAALAAVRDLYRFGLANGLPAATRRAAAAALGRHPEAARLPATGWALFLELDPDARVAAAAAGAWLDAAPATALEALRAMLEAGGCASRGGVLAALLARMEPGWSGWIAPLCEATDPAALEAALGPAPGLSGAARRLFGEWLAGLDRHRDPGLADFLAGALRDRPGPGRDPRRVAGGFLPALPSASVIHLRPAAAAGPAPARERGLRR